MMVVDKEVDRETDRASDIRYHDKVTNYHLMTEFKSTHIWDV